MSKRISRIVLALASGWVREEQDVRDARPKTSMIYLVSIVGRPTELDRRLDSGEVESPALNLIGNLFIKTTIPPIAVFKDNATGTSVGF